MPIKKTVCFICLYLTLSGESAAGNIAKDAVRALYRLFCPPDFWTTSISIDATVFHQEQSSTIQTKQPIEYTKKWKKPALATIYEGISLTDSRN